MCASLLGLVAASLVPYRVTGNPPLAAQLELLAGLELQTFAETPHLHNPTAIDVDAAGRVWVAEAVNYRTWGGRNPGLRHPDGDRIVVLEDTDGDGACDSSRVFVQDPELVAPLGIALVGDWVYVSCSPHLFRYRDTDGDGRADVRETVLSGFGGFDHDHGLHSVVPHLDGKLYVAVGNAGPHLVEGPDGVELRSGSIYTGGGPATADNKPGLVGSDGRLWTGGLVLRFAHDGAELEVLAHNFRNPYEVAVSRAGLLYTADNDDDGNQACRTTWVMPGGDYGFFGGGGSRTWQADRRAGQSTAAAHWHQDDPGVAPMGTVNGAGGPTGVAVYEGELLAPWVGGAVLNCDAGARVVYAHRPRVRGTGVDLEEGWLVRAAATTDRGEGGDWFRPSDVCVGPAGEVYVADWYDPGVGGHAMGDRRAQGRILCIRPVGPRTVAPKPDLGTEAGRKAALHSPCVSVRELARAAGATVDVSAPPQHAAREEAYALRDAAVGSDGWARLLELATSFDPADRWMLETLGHAFEGREDAAFAELAADLAGPPLDWSPRFEALAWRLHPASAIAPLTARAMAPTLTENARRRALDALAFAPTRAAGEALVAAATAGPDDLRGYALAWLEQRDDAEWHEYGLLAGLATGALADAERVWHSGVLRRGLVDVDVDVHGADTLWLVVSDGGDGNGYDWAAWGEPRFIMDDGREVPLRSWTEARAEWGSVNLDRDPAGGSLEVGDHTFARGIGAHARSEVACAVPAGAARFRAQAGPEKGGTDQVDGRGTSIEFEVWLVRPPAPKPLLEWRTSVRDSNAPLAVRRAAALELAADPRGALLLFEARAEGAFPPELVEEVAAALTRNPDLAVRALASEHFPRAGAANAPTPAAVLALAGALRRGRELFQDVGRTQCATCHALQLGDTRFGGDLGPELTAIRKKLAPAALLDAILNPSAAIAFGYDTYVVRTTDGELYSGFMLADGPVVALLGTDGARYAIPAEEVAAKRKQTLSTMPEGVALGLGAQDLADLVAFLSDDPAAPQVFGEPVALFDGSNLDTWTHHLSDGGRRMEDVWSVRDGVLRCEGSPAGYIRTREAFTNYRLVVEWRFDPARGAGNSGVLLRVVGEDKVWPRSIEAQLQSGNAGDFWNIDAFGMRAAPERTNGRNTVRKEPSSEKPIGEWNRYEILVDGPRVELRVNGVLQNTADWCDEVPGFIALQSEGAVIEFREVTLWPIERK
jgi:putative membrane-bound dehydrogenase-like protein